MYQTQQYTKEKKCGPTVLSSVRQSIFQKKDYYQEQKDHFLIRKESFIRMMEGPKCIYTNKTSEYMKQRLIKLQEKIDTFIIVVRNFSTPFQ